MKIEHLEEIDSTNSELLRRVSAGRASHGDVIVADMQTAGRGRAGRVWVSPGKSGAEKDAAGKGAAGQDRGVANLYLSMLLVLSVPLAELAPLTLALGVAARRVLPSLQLKWPNDLMLDGKKVGGILLEVAQPGALCTVVAGIGINVRMPESVEIDQAFTDLARQGIAISAAELAPKIAAEWQRAASEFCDSRLVGFLSEFADADLLRGEVLIVSDDPDTPWVGAGISQRGGLLLQMGDRARELMSGEARVRLHR